MKKTAYAQPEYRALARLARKYYNATGPNSWEHIQAVRKRAQKMMRRLENRQLTPAEYAAILLHDNTKREFGAENHGRMGADRAAMLLAGAMILNQAQVDEAQQAIRVHDDNLAKFPSENAELLASADANPPDIDWMLNKSYGWQIGHDIPREDRIERIIAGMSKKYGRGGTFNYPGIYNRYYGDRVAEIQDYFANMDPAEVEDRLMRYRKAHGIKPDEARVLPDA